MAESDGLNLWNLVLFDQNLTGINRFLCLGLSREDRKTSCPLNPLALNPLFWGVGSPMKTVLTRQWLE